MHVISLGAGVQSSTMALMAAAGEIAPMPDCAIFADTGWEPKAVYEHLERLEKALPFPVYRVSGGNLRNDTVAPRSKRPRRFSDIPWFTINDAGIPGMGKRQCTAHYKIHPINRKIVELCNGQRRKGQAHLWIGISTDEAFRLKPSRVQYIVRRHPLIDMRMNRGDCRAWLERHGWDAPRSACIGCPYRTDEQWQFLTPEEIADAVIVDEVIRNEQAAVTKFVHRTLKPLRDVDFSNRGQSDLFNNECEGMCGI